MKKSIYFNGALVLLFLFILFSSCISSQSFIPVKGKGASVDKSYSISDFHGIDVSGGFDVALVQGNSEGVILLAQENLFEHITVRVEQGVLKIFTENNIMATQPLKAKITYKSIDNLKVSGGGDVTGETPVNVPMLEVTLSGGGDLTTEINTDELNCNISGGGDVTINGKIKRYELDMSGGGDVQSEITASVVFFEISGGGDVTLKFRDKAADASIRLSGGGDATLSGQVSEFDIHVNGGGDVFAGDLLTATTTFQASGGSDLHVNAAKELTGNISGGGNVYYSGSPEIVTIDAKGGSEIRKQ
jgi:hypothetical protein